MLDVRPLADASRRRTCEGTKALSRRAQRSILLGDTQPQQRQRRRIRVERRQWNRGYFRLANQPVGEIDVALVAESAVVDQLEIGAGCRRRFQSRAPQKPGE